MTDNKEQRRDSSFGADHRRRIPQGQGEHPSKPKKVITLAELLYMASLGLFSKPQQSGKRIDGTPGFVPKKKE